jgi:hypothetical protein
MLGTRNTVHALFFLKTFEFNQGGEQGPAFIALKANQALAATHACFKSKPCFGDAIGMGGLPIELPKTGFDT